MYAHTYNNKQINYSEVRIKRQVTNCKHKSTTANFYRAHTTPIVQKQVEWISVHRRLTLHQLKLSTNHRKNIALSVTHTVSPSHGISRIFPWRSIGTSHLLRRICQTLKKYVPTNTMADTKNCNPLNYIHEKFRKLLLHEKLLCTVFIMRGTHTYLHPQEHTHTLHKGYTIVMHKYMYTWLHH